MEEYYHYKLLITILEDISKFHDLAKKKIDLLEKATMNPIYASYEKGEIFTDEQFTAFKLQYKNKKSFELMFLQIDNRHKAIYRNTHFYELVIYYYSITPEQKEINMKCITNFISLLRASAFMSHLKLPDNKELFNIHSEFLKNRYFQLWLKYIVYCINLAE